LDAEFRAIGLNAINWTNRSPRQPFARLSRFDDVLVDLIRTATRQAFENLVDLANCEPVSFVLVAGDLWDRSWPDAGPRLFFIRQAKRLREARIPVYIVKGIHVRNLLETAVLQVQHSPDLTEDDVRWIQQFAAHLITELNVLKEPNLLYAPMDEENPVAEQVPGLR
jgi:hypothetical protein